MHIWKPEELEFPYKITGICPKEDRERKVLRQPRRPKKVICVPFVHFMFTSVEGE